MKLQIIVTKRPDTNFEKDVCRDLIFSLCTLEGGNGESNGRGNKNTCTLAHGGHNLTCLQHDNNNITSTCLILNLWQQY